MAGVIAAALMGFLIFNLPIGRKRPLRVFMGDSGSTFLGFAVVWVTVSVCQGPGREMSPVIGLWFAALPLFDLFTCIVRRLAIGQSPATPDQDHAHHTLERAGVKRRDTLAVLIALQLVYCIIGVAGHRLGVPDPIMFTLWSVAGFSQIWLIRAIGKLYRRLTEQAAA
jgi:UDP-GlcNAc:undecaprenyl-phosphate GlcNAc-1-phosphate transferase